MFTQLSSILFGTYFFVAPFMEIQEELCYRLFCIGSLCNTWITLCNSASVCAAVTVKRNRPVLTGTVGGRMPLRIMPSRSHRRLASNVSSLEPMMIGNIGVSFAARDS